jgi:hypothetical protein
MLPEADTGCTSVGGLGLRGSVNEHLGLAFTKCWIF